MFAIACVAEEQERKNRFAIGMHGEDFDALDLGLCRVTRVTRVLDSKLESSNFLLLEYSHRNLI